MCINLNGSESPKSTQTEIRIVKKQSVNNNQSQSTHKDSKVISLQENNHNYSELLIRHSQTIVLGVTNSAIKIHGIVTIPK